MNDVENPLLAPALPARSTESRERPPPNKTNTRRAAIASCSGKRRPKSGPTCPSAATTPDADEGGDCLPDEPVRGLRVREREREMTRVLPRDGLARPLVSSPGRHPERALVRPSRPSPPASGSGSGAPPGPAPASASGSGPLKPCATATMLQTLTNGLATVREPRMVRERFEEQLRALVRATSVSLRHDEDDATRPNVVSFDLPGSPIEGRPRLEAVFDPARPVDERARRMLGRCAGCGVAA